MRSFDGMSGQVLEVFGRAHGIVKRPGERDDVLYARVRAALETQPSGTLAAVEYAVDNAIYDAAPVTARSEDVKRLLAVRWLRAERPRGLWARLRWLWRLAREVWR